MITNIDKLENIVTWIQTNAKMGVERVGPKEHRDPRLIYEIPATIINEFKLVVQDLRAESGIARTVDKD